ncbi:MAG: DUF4974 domain-containing protein [Bacteroidia bacterium]|nr:MAG: DUF4974 domain-containing protein [Bacteroidia bacterium]
MHKEARIPDHILTLIIEREKGAIDGEQSAALHAFLDEHPDLQGEVEAYARIVSKSRQLVIRKEIDRKKAWKKIRMGIGHGHSKRRYIRRWMKVAAVLLPLLGVIGFYFFQPGGVVEEEHSYADIMGTVRQGRATLVLGTGEQVILDGSIVGQMIEREGVSIYKESSERISYTAAASASMHSLVVPRGGEYQLVLPDGTIAHINSGSQLDFPTIFDTHSREVSLSGEAFFEVAHDPERPFIVNSPDFRITATGTSFNVYNYPGDVAETTLVNGRVLVASGRHEGVPLQPGQQASMLHPEDSIRIREVDTDLYISWVYGMFRFRDMKLTDLARRMERWYDVDIVFADDAAGDIRLTGAMQKEKAFESLVWLIEQSANVTFDVVEDKAVVGLKQ